MWGVSHGRLPLHMSYWPEYSSQWVWELYSCGADCPCQSHGIMWKWEWEELWSLSAVDQAWRSFAWHALQLQFEGDDSEHMNMEGPNTDKNYCLHFAHCPSSFAVIIFHKLALFYLSDKYRCTVLSFCYMSTHYDLMFFLTCWKKYNLFPVPSGCEERGMIKSNRINRLN